MADEGNTRRLAAILAADVADYSRLMHEDENATIAAWQEARRETIDPIISEHQGRIVKHTGDGFLAEFTTVTQAVQCAVDLQDKLEDGPLDFRMGVNLGEIVADADDIHGDGVNIAARLEGLADSGGICISGSVHDQVHNKLDLSFTDMGEQTVKNIARPVRAFKVNMGETKTGSVTPPPKPAAKPRMAIAASIAAVIVIAAGLLIWEPWVTRVEPASVAKMALKLPDKPSVAVLPFANMSGDKAQEYFSDGITEDIITDLSKVTGLFVIARTSTNRYKGTSVDVRQIARELGVRYIVEGSVRKAAGKVRITAQLIDAKTGNHVWAERYDRDLKDVFAIQDDVAEQIVSKLAVKLTADEKARIAHIPTDNAEAYDFYLRGVATVLPPRPKNLAAAAKLFEKVIALDPEFAGGYAGLSFVNTFRFKTGVEGQAALDRALELAEKALALDDTLYMSNRAAGVAYSNSKRLDEALAAMERTLKLEPGNAAAHSTYALFLARAGRAGDGIKHAKLARRLSPTYAGALSALGRNLYFARQYEEAIRAFESLNSLRPQYSLDALSLSIASNMMAGREKEAKATVKKLLALNPKYTVNFFDRTSHYKFKEDKDHLLNALRRAGLPEGAPPEPTAPPLSIVVLPFDNLSDDKSQGYFADGITEDLITDLSRIRGMFVIARGTSFTYKGKAVKARDVAKDLKVRYVLEGSVRRAGDQVRVNAQLIDGETGAHLWSDRFDREIKELFSLQDEVTGRIASVLKGELLQAESHRLRRGPPSNLDAWETALQGYVKAFDNPRNVEGYREAKVLLDRAIEMDRNLTIGWIGLAHLHYIASTRGYPGVARNVSRKLLLASAQRAVSLDPKNADAQTELGLAYRINREPEKARAACETALEINPNYDEAHACAGMAYVALGKLEKASLLLEKALQLNPRHNAFLRRYFIGMVHIFDGQPAKAVAVLKKGLAEFPTHAGLNYSLVSALALSGRDAEANKALAAYNNMKSARNLNKIEQIRDRLAYLSPNIGKLAEGLRRAGMPEK